MMDTASKREQQREERRKQILDAALTVFSQKGFHPANVSDVAAEAGVSQGTIYWYFDSKEELFQAACASILMSFGQEMLATLEHCTTATDKLRALASSVEEFSEGFESLFPMFLSYWASSPKRDATGQLWVDLLIEYKDIIVDVIEEGVRNGEFRPVDSESLVWAFLAAYDGLAAYRMLLPDLDLVACSRALIETVLAGLVVVE